MYALFSSNYYVRIDLLEKKGPSTQLERKKIWSIYKEICTVQPPLGFLHGKMEFYAGNYIAPSMYLACRAVGKSLNAEGQ